MPLCDPSQRLLAIQGTYRKVRCSDHLAFCTDEVTTCQKVHEQRLLEGSVRVKMLTNKFAQRIEPFPIPDLGGSKLCGTQIETIAKAKSQLKEEREKTIKISWKHHLEAQVINQRSKQRNNYFTFN